MQRLLLFIISSYSIAILAQKPEDSQAIKAMCGCYEIQFNFAETFQYPKDSVDYHPSKVKLETALEWARLIEDEPKKISIQHILIVGQTMIVKHWRQDWLFENSIFYDYNGFNDWKLKILLPGQVKGQWTQKVYEVDDKPRYQGSASWIHIDGRHFWDNTTNAPLPRREYTQRSDYNITKRANHIELSTQGWIHDQDNDKIIRTEHGDDYVLASEKGYNVYTKVDDSKCAAAQNWWNENKTFWVKVRTKWEAEFAKNKDLKLKTEVEGKPLYRHLQALKPGASQDKINKVIDRFIISE
ncbi:MAG: hypothetical protein IPP04_14960 [Saprospiraceae bacterium]|nr:hypothetical protein [Saprospiraceae bacterium]MBK9931154.1 hypothetical protein [Saprospiraceae bacterium]